MNFSLFIRFIRGAELRIGVIESSDGQLKLLPVVDYQMEDDQVRSHQHKLNVDSDGIPTGKLCNCHALATCVC